MSRTKRLLRLGSYILYLLLVLEVGSRAYWRFARGVPLASEPTDWYGVFFEGFRESALVPDPPVAGDERLDVLLLGGSTLAYLHRDRGDLLRARLEEETGRPVRLFGFAERAHTTRDSLLKYRMLGDAAFDLVVLYHVVNDTRLNNAPADMFRADYRHASWYDQLEHMLAYEPWDAALVFPFTLRYAWISAIDTKRLRCYVPKNKPNPAWTQYGGEIKTAEPFRANLCEMIDLAGARGHAVALLTAAWYHPADYTLERFEAHELDYADHKNPTEIWGEPSHVARAIVEHDRLLRELPLPPHAFRVDIAAAIPKDGAHFRDICHLTEQGEVRWIETLAEAVAAESASRGRAIEAAAR